MWKINCGCNPPMRGPIDFNIIDPPSFYIDSVTLLPRGTDRDDCLKEKIIQEYLDIINKLECGIQPDIENILEEISLIDMKNNWNFSVAKEIFSSIPEEEDYLRRSQYLSEFKNKEEKEKVLKNLGIDGMKHVILSKREFDQLKEYDKDTIYFVTG